MSRGASYARRRLGFKMPALSYVLLACIDEAGALDPNSDACPGSMIATFVERDQPKGDLAFIVVGRAGMLGRRTLYGTAISFDPPRCTPVAVLDLARARGIRWERAETTMLAYEPRSQQPPMWILKRQATPLLELSDADCIAAAK